MSKEGLTKISAAICCVGLTFIAIYYNNHPASIFAFWGAFIWGRSKWVEIFRFRTDVVIIPGTRKPDGTLNSYSWPRRLINEKRHSICINSFHIINQIAKEEN